MTYPQNTKKPHAENIDAFNSAPSQITFKEIYDNANVAMLALYDDGAVHCYVNRSACEMTGYNFSELMNMGFKDLVHPEELGKIENRLEKRQKGIELPFCYETFIVTKNGDAIPVEATVTEGQKENNGIHFVILRDIRKEKLLQYEMQKNLNMLKEELQQTRFEMENINVELLQTQQAMSVLARNLEGKKVELEKKINTTITTKVMPVIKGLLTDGRIKRFWPEINLVAEHLNSIKTNSELHRNIIHMLTETEMKIAAMVKNKMGTKEIAKIMYVSLETVKAHRKNIRRKLKISNTKQKLSEYLEIVMGE
jgi:PAS domain S-box-containing protein